MIYDFNYLKPGSLNEALSMLSEHKDECKVICGGQSLLIVMRQGMVAPEYLLDIKHVKELNYISFDAKDGLKIGATTTHRTIEKSDVIAKNYPVLVAMENKLASIQTPIPTDSSRPKGSGADLATIKMRYRKNRYKATSATEPTSPSSSAIMAKIESVGACGI